MSAIKLHGLFRYSITTVIWLFSIFACYGQSKDSLINAIRRTFQETNSSHHLVTVKLENEDFLEQMTDGGGSLTGYFKKDTICKVHLWVGLSFAVRQFDYYFNKGKLCFVYETEEDFPYDEKKETLDFGKLTPAFEGRYYINNGKLIDAKLKGKKRMDNESPAAALKGFNADAQSYSKTLRKHLKKVGG